MRKSLAAVATLAAVIVGAVAGSGSTAAVAPAFSNFAAPAPLGRDAGEPSIGANWSTGNVMMQAGLETLRVSGFDDATGAATWQDVSSTLTSVTSLDPIGFVDRNTNRTFASQLTGDCSLLAFSDNDGTSWTQNPIGCGIAAAADHQTVGGGPPAPGAGGTTTLYPDMTYYCAQAVVSAQCAASRDGGLTFGPGVPIYNVTQCGGLHGHIKVGPDGTAYVPNADCGGQSGVAVSRDNGTTWTVRKVPGSTTQDESDPSVAVGSGNTVYFGWQNGASNTTGSPPWVAVSHDHGQTWTNVQQVPGSIANVQFPAMVAGDDDRAAFAFLGTPTAGNDQAKAFAGVWHLYVSTTYDGGATWTTVDATPSDPVQRGCIWLGGGSNQCRNLLDFMDAFVDGQGRILVGYADGCIGACVTGTTNSYSAVATIARQSGGTRLLAAFGG